MPGFKLLDAYVEVTAKVPDMKAATDKMAKDVQSASDRIESARKREADAAGQLRLAELRLAELRKTESSDSVRLIAAEERYAAAQRNSAAAIAASARASSGLIAARARDSEPEMRKVGGGFGDSLVSGLTSTISGAVSGIVGAMSYQVMNGVENVVQAGFQLMKSDVIDFNSQLENANIGFTTMLGSGEKAKSFISDLKDFAAKTPFEFGNLVQNAQQMLGMGIAAKDIIPDLTALGDSVASIGGSADQVNSVVLAFDQMSAKGTLDMGNITQLAQNGVPSALKILAASYNTTTGAMIKNISTGKILSSDALPRLVKGLEQGTKSTAALGGMMDKQSQTFAGAASNIGDAIQQTTASAFKPMFIMVEGLTKRLATFTGSKAFSKWAADVGKDVTGWMHLIGDAFKQVFDDPKTQKSIKTIGDDLGKLFKQVGPDLKAMLPGFVTFAKDVIPQLATTLGQLVKHGPEFAKMFGDAGKDVAGSADAFAGLIKFLSDLVTGTADAINAWNNFWAGASKAQDAFYGGFKGFTSGLLSTIGALPGKFTQYGVDMIAGLIGGIQSKIGDVASIVGTVADTVKNVFTGPQGIDSHSPSKVFEKYGTWITQGLTKGLLGTVDQIRTASGQLSDAIKSKFKGDTEKSMLAQLSTVTKALTTEAGKRDKIAERLTAQRDKLAGLKADRASYKSGVRDSVMSAGNIVDTYQTGVDAMATWKDQSATYAAGLAAARAADAATARGTSVGASAGTLDGHGYQASYSMVQGAQGTAVSDFMRDNAAPGPKPLTGLALIKSNLKKLLGDTKKFTAGMKTLVKRGMYKDLFQQLMDAGPTAGLPIVTELLADKGAFNDINSLGKQLSTAGNALGEVGAHYTYDNSITDTKQRIIDLNSKMDTITAVMIVEASKIDEVGKVVAAVNALAKTAKAKKAAKK